MSHHEDTPKGAPVTFQVDGHEVEGFHHESLLTALRRAGYEVPSLCYHEAVSTYGACRLCLVEVHKGRKRRITTSCNYPVTRDLKVMLDTPAVTQNRRIVFQLLLARAPASPELRELAAEYGVHSTPFEVDAAHRENRCILCGLCSRVCDEIVGAHAIAFSGRGLHKDMVSPFDETAEACIGCGACVVVCPTNCIGVKEENDIRTIVKWHRDLPLQKCEKCGRPFAPTFQLMDLGKRVGMKLQDFKTCNDCR
jgi:NADH dehydrogenase/NADH:ubiquinone oxidoreductase subunit G